ncbi:MAG TPA: FkbM family methyltransferase [Pseudomonadales bacterium]|nr:FkbM family methyltransferase [Pseudomonadales bacterium]
MTFYDLGTHYGEGLRKVTAIHDIDNTWQIYTFEPNPTINVHLHLKDYPYNVNIIRKAAWTNYGTMRFNAQEQSGHGFGAGLDGYGSDGAHWYAGLVPTVDIVHMIKAYNDRCIVKMDIEGAEWPIMEKLTNDIVAMSLIDTLYIEWHMAHGNEHAKDRIMKTLRHHGVTVAEWE